jgi:hypothetical protein
MGNTFIYGDLYPDPVPTNLCDTQETTSSDWTEDFCWGHDKWDRPGEIRPEGNLGRYEYCRAMSINGKEWLLEENEKRLCFDINRLNFLVTNSSDDPNLPGSVNRSKTDCVNCNPTGFRIKCKRVSYTGDPLKCCLRDKACDFTGIDKYLCFEDDHPNSSACDPSVRDMSGKSCRDRLYDFCINDTSVSLADKWLPPTTSGGGYQTTPPLQPSTSDLIHIDGAPYDDDIKPRTISQPCLKALYRNLYEGQASCLKVQGSGSYDTKGGGYLWAKKLLIDTIKELPEHISSIDPLSKFFFSICKSNPSLCEDYLTSKCKSQTKESLVKNHTLLSVCGCYLSDDQYSNVYGIQKECTSICGRVENIPLSDDSKSGGVKVCQTSQCVIDDLSVDILRSSGKVSFEQLCSGCSGGTCTCTILDNSLTLLDSKYGLNISQRCGSSSTCYSKVQTDQGNTVSFEVPCQGNSLTGDVSDDLKERKNLLSYKLIIIFLIVIFLFIIIYTLSSYLISSGARVGRVVN